MDRVGKLAIFIRVNHAVFEECNIQANLIRQEAKADFLAREKLAFQFNDLLTRSGLEPKDVMGENFNELVDEFCAGNSANMEVDNKIRPLVEAQLEVMEQLENSLFFSRQQDIKYSVEHMGIQLPHKIESLDILPIEEQRQVASAKFSGIYVFAGRNYIENIKYLCTALYIQNLVYSKTFSYEDAFILGKMKLAHEDKSGIDLIIGAASEELLEAQEWLGNYYACNSEKPKGIYWLENADKNGSETAIDPIMETKNLGRPTVYSYLL